jgi:hypothetical protein
MGLDQYLIDPHQGVGPLRFGMSRAEAERALAPGKRETVDRRPKGGELKDFFPAHGGLQVIYDADERVAAVQFPEMDNVVYPPDVRMNRSYGKILDWAKSKDPSLIEDGRTFQSDALGLAVGGRTAAKSSKLEHVMVYRPRYYEDARRVRAEFKARQGSGNA